MADLREYQPTWRDSIARALLGDNPGVATRNLVGGLTGSTGLGTQNMGLIDLTPAGVPLAAQEAYRAGDPQGMALSVAPFGGAAHAGERAIPKVVKALEGEILPPLPKNAKVLTDADIVANAKKAVESHLGQTAGINDPTSPEYMAAKAALDNWAKPLGGKQTIPISENGQFPPSFAGGKKPSSPIVQKLQNLAEDWSAKLDNKVEQIQSLWQAQKYVPHLEPFDWKSATNPVVQKQLDLPPHAPELGFNPNFPLYKGGYLENIHKTALPNPMDKTHERGLFFSDNPDIAQWYGSPVEFTARPQRPAAIDYVKATNEPQYDSKHLTNIIEAARKAGHDFLAVKNIKDVGNGGRHSQNQYVVLDPSIMRKPNAAFDPNKLNVNNLLAGIGGAGVVGGATMSPDVMATINALKGPQNQ